jgi:hypothetical protein
MSSESYSYSSSSSSSREPFFHPGFRITEELFFAKLHWSLSTLSDSTALSRTTTRTSAITTSPISTLWTQLTLTQR